jgi:hypothetical protein
MRRGSVLDARTSAARDRDRTGAATLAIRTLALRLCNRATRSARPIRLLSAPCLGPPASTLTVARAREQASTTPTTSLPSWNATSRRLVAGETAGSSPDRPRDRCYCFGTPGTRSRSRRWALPATSRRPDPRESSRPGHGRPGARYSAMQERAESGWDYSSSSEPATSREFPDFRPLPRPISRRGSSLLNDCDHGCRLRDIDRMTGRNLLNC